MSSAPPRLAPDVTRARACLLVNALGCPGIGSLMGGRRVGWAQLLLTALGMMWQVQALGRIFIGMMRTGRLPADWTDALQLGLRGLAVLLVAWGWSIVTGLLMLRQARAAEQSEQAHETDAA